MQVGQIGGAKLADRAVQLRKDDLLGSPLASLFESLAQTERGRQSHAQASAELGRDQRIGLREELAPLAVAEQHDSHAEFTQLLRAHAAGDGARRTWIDILRPEEEFPIEDGSDARQMWV
jgi:hypothetical protein